jgi:hypothetical protein
VRSRRIRWEDCFPVGRHERIVDKPKKISFSHDIWAGGSRATFTEMLKQFPMAERGWWVWQSERLRPQSRDVRFDVRPPLIQPQFKPQSQFRPPLQGLNLI